MRANSAHAQDVFTNCKSQFNLEYECISLDEFWRLFFRSCANSAKVTRLSLCTLFSRTIFRTRASFCTLWRIGKLGEFYSIKSSCMHWMWILQCDQRIFYGVWFQQTKRRWDTKKAAQTNKLTARAPRKISLFRWNMCMNDFMAFVCVCVRTFSCSVQLSCKYPVHM